MRSLSSLAGLLALGFLSACAVGVDLAREGFPCDPDGSCQQGLVCEDAICVAPATLPTDAGPDAGPTDGGSDAGPTDGGSDAGPTDGGCVTPCEAPTGTIVLTSTPSSLPADGSARSSVIGTSLFLQNGNPAPNGTLFTIAVTDGTLISADADNTTPGLQIALALGQIAFNYKAGQNAGPVTVSATSVRGTAYGETTITLLPVPASSTLVVSPTQVVADGVATAQLTFTARDGAGTLTPITSVVITVDQGTLSEIASPGVGQRAYLWSSFNPGTATASVISVGGIAWGLPSAQLLFLNAPPKITVSDVAGRIPYDTVTLPFTVSDPNPSDTLTLTVSMSGPGAIPAILHHPTQGGPFSTITTSLLDPPVAIPERPGLYPLLLEVSDGQTTSTATLVIGVRDFVPIMIPGASPILKWEAPAIDRDTGDVCLASRDNLIAMRSEATGAWMTLDVTPFIPFGLKRPPVAWSHDPLTGIASCLVGNDDLNSSGTNLLRISPDTVTAGGWWLEGLLEPRDSVSMAEGPSGEVWIAFSGGLAILEPGAPATGPAFDFTFRGNAPYNAIGVTPSDVIFATDRNYGYFRSALPFDPMTPRMPLSGGTARHVSQPSFVRGAAGAVGAWMAERSGVFWYLPDVDTPVAAATPYPVSRGGVLLQDGEPVQRSSVDGDVWMAIKPGIARYVSYWDQWVVLPIGVASYPGLADCTNLNGIAIDSAAPQTRGRRLLVACKNNGLFELIGDP